MPMFLGMLSVIFELTPLTFCELSYLEV